MSTAHTSLSPPKQLRARSHIFKKLALLCSSLLVAFIIGEIGLRLLGVFPERVWEPHPRLGWQHVPRASKHWTEEGDGQVQINSLGFRDRERTVEKSPDTYRIAVFGDSMTEAVQVNLDQTFCHLMEDSLRGKGISCEVLNFGVNGYGPLQELLLFQHEGPRYRPDCVVVALFLDNDVADSYPGLRDAGEGRPFAKDLGDALGFDFSRAEESYADYQKEPIYSLRKYSSTYRLLRSWKRRAQIRAEGVQPIPNRFLLYQKPLQPRWEQGWAIVERILLEFATEAQRQKTELVLLSLPAGQVIRPESWKNILLKTPAMGGETWDLDGPERRLTAFAKKHSIRLLTAAPDFEKAPPGPPLFFGDVGHITARGHQVVAATLERFLQDQNVLPPAKNARP